MPPRSGPSWTYRKRRSAAAELDTVDIELLGIEMSQFVGAPRPLALAPFVYDMDDPGARIACIRQLWTADYTEAIGALASANPELALLLQTTIASRYNGTDAGRYAADCAQRLDAVLSDLARMRSQKLVPLWTAAFSVMSMGRQLSSALWASIGKLHRGLLMSETWTKRLVADAVALRPPPAEPLVRAVHCTVFDNYTRQCFYKSQVSAGEGGYRLDMTNWGVLRVPARLLPSNFDGCQVFNHLYRSDISLSRFVGSFSWNSVQLVANKEARFVRFLKAAASGDLLKRPATTPDWVCEVDWQTPIWGRLQSKSDDVRVESMIQMKSAPPGAWITFQGGDGLSVMRLNQEIAKDPGTFVDTAPALVPMLGEYPHGHHHILHTVHRGFKHLILRCAKECGNPAIEDDPAEVKHHNSHLYFQWVMVRAAAEYLHEISRGDGGLDFEDVPSFMRAAEQNVDLGWLVHYLCDGGFMLLEFKQALRSNDTAKLDDLWREFVTLARTANKTNYGVLAIMQVYRSTTLHPQLAQFWRTIRTLPMSLNPGARVGWDTPCEWLHCHITESIQTRVSETRIESFIKEQPFLKTCERGVRSGLGTDVDTAESKLKGMEDDVGTIKKMFRTLIGSTWASASRMNTSPKLFGGQAPRGGLPWKAYERTAQQTGNDSTGAYVRKHIMSYAFSHEWQP